MEETSFKKNATFSSFETWPTSLAISQSERLCHCLSKYMTLIKVWGSALNSCSHDFKIITTSQKRSNPFPCVLGIRWWKWKNDRNLDCKVFPPNGLNSKHSDHCLDEVEDWWDNPDEPKAKNTKRSCDERERAKLWAATIFVEVHPIRATQFHVCDLHVVIWQVTPQQNASN